VLAVEVVRALLEAGARPEVRVAGGSRRVPAEVALEHRHIAVVRLINSFAASKGKTDWVNAGLRGLFDTDENA
jgi:hypothetical protein